MRESAKLLKKGICVICSFVLVFSAVPARAFSSTLAAEMEGADSVEPSAATSDEQVATDTVEPSAADSAEQSDAVSDEPSAAVDESSAAISEEPSAADPADLSSVGPSESSSSDGSDVSPMSTVDEDGQYSVVVDYVSSSTGDKIAPSYETVVKEGGSWSAASPTLEGYVLHDSTQSTMSGTVSGEEHWLVYTVAYDAADTTYTVTHLKQLDGAVGYYVADMQTFTGVVGQTVNVTPKSYAGHTCVTTDLSLVVTAGGLANKTLYYDQDDTSYSIWFYTQGTYVPTITAYAGDVVTAPANPTRVGYTFKGWDTNGDGQAEALPTTMPAENVDAVALWEPATVGYTINYYQQSTDGTSYVLERTVQAQGTTGDTSPDAPAMNVSETGDYAYFKYGHETPVVIKADGSSVLNVYYDRETVTVKTYLTMDDGSLVEYNTYTALYGATVTLPAVDQVIKDYQDAGGSRDYLTGWTNKKDKEHSASAVYYHSPLPLNSRCVDFDTMTSVNYAIFSTAAHYPYYYTFNYEQLDGSYADDGITTMSLNYSNRWFIGSRDDVPGFTLVGGRVSTSHYTGGGTSAIVWGDWVEPHTDGRVGLHLYAATTNAGLYQFTRNSYDATYYSGGTQVGQVSHLYEQTYDPNDDVPSSSLTPPTAGYVFAGWYDNSACEGEAITSMTQSIGATVFYAKWTAPDVKVTFDSNGGSEVSSQSVDRGASASQPANPTKSSGASFLGWYYYGDSDAPIRWSFDKPIEGDITLVALWDYTEDNVAYTVVHKTADGTVLATQTSSGEIGSTVTVAALVSDDARRAGYAYVDAGYRSLVLTDDASANVVTFVYSDDAAYEYTVRYIDRATGKEIVDANVFGSDENLVILKALDLDGYTVEDADGWVSADSRDHTFYYTKDAVAEDSGGSGETGNVTPVSTTAATSEATPKTGDETTGILPIVVLLAGEVVLSGALLRRRHTED